MLEVVVLAVVAAVAAVIVAGSSSSGGGGSILDLIFLLINYPIPTLIILAIFFVIKLKTSSNQWDSSNQDEVPFDYDEEFRQQKAARAAKKAGKSPNSVKTEQKTEQQIDHHKKPIIPDGSTHDDFYNVFKLQFGLHATAFKFRDQIKEFVRNANFNSGHDLQKLIIQSKTLLTEYQDYIKYGHVQKAIKTTLIKKAEHRYDELIDHERAKLTQETFKKLKGRTLHQEQLTEANKPDFMEIKEYITFSIIVVFADTDVKIKDDYSWGNYSEIMGDLSRIDPSEIVAAEIIWSPDVEEDVLTEDDITQFYPEMKLL